MTMGVLLSVVMPFSLILSPITELMNDFLRFHNNWNNQQSFKETTNISIHQISTFTHWKCITNLPINENVKQFKQLLSIIVINDLLWQSWHSKKEKKEFYSDFNFII
ncbi:CLUMA_CG008099, isoform A [Clunio marinus]|uniref:CLUMA_CG008099, isoform A n=1 Tax=Clunio marinus TaxID=568069 RepID=A0A1J1I2M1_9DIPT|nr:CLUMA_CG008099, isoform A [Clunio marinus]